ncbi:MAG: hypothetical protein GX978_09130 [Tissierellia bacterium]|mgnify:CR=1 FL=1|nr:hypothetical protein [Tissierellia bacterium]
MKTFFILLNDQTEPSQETHEAHRAHIEALRQSGQLIQSGNFVDYKGNMALIKAEDKKAALVLALSDPYVREGCKTFKMYQIELEEYNA